MFGSVRGRAVIINNKYFLDSLEAKFKTRHGSEKDVVDLQKLFDALHFEVILHENKSAEVIDLFLLLLSCSDCDCWYQQHL